MRAHGRPSLPFLVLILAGALTPPGWATVHQWSDSFGDAATQVLYGLATDDAGAVITTGYFYGTLDLGGTPLVNAGGRDLFVAKHASDGSHVWSAGFGDSDNQYGTAVAMDGDGNVIVTGVFEGSIDFGGGPLTSAGSYDVFVAKFSTAGAHAWSQNYGDLNGETARALDLDSADRVLVAGYFSGAIQFGANPALASAGGYDVFVANLGTTGNAVWSRGAGDASLDFATAVAVDEDDDVLLAGYFQGSIDFGAGPLVSAGNFDVFLAKFASDGTHRWSEIFGDSGMQLAAGLDTDAERYVLIGGYFDGSIDLGGETLASAGASDLFLAKLLPHDLPAVIGDRVWNDTDGDGIQDAGESGFEALPVYLYDQIGSLLDYTVTGADGGYVFSGLTWTAVYRLRFFPPIGYELSPQNQGGDDGRDSDADPMLGITPLFMLKRADDGTRWDAGMTPLPSCWPPDEPLYIYEMTLTDDGNDYPVLHFMDPNQPDQVTGYDVYRAPDPGLPPESWSLVASNVIDMDEATPNQQWVDTSGDPGTWYYQVAAYNHHCPPESAEGPW